MMDARVVQESLQGEATHHGARARLTETRGSGGDQVVIEAFRVER